MARVSEVMFHWEFYQRNDTCDIQITSVQFWISRLPLTVNAKTEKGFLCDYYFDK